MQLKMYLTWLLTILWILSKFIVVKTLLTEPFSEDKVRYFFWSKNIAEQEVGLGNYGNITKAPTKILIHGYLGKDHGERFMFYGPLVQKYIKTNVNVICVDWSYYSRRLYPTSVKWTRSIADLTARFIIELNKKIPIPFSDFHLHGHSLGAHISGFIGKYIQEKNNGEKIGRITGIDPAGPLFYTRPNTDRLFKTDAEKVDTIIADIMLYGMNQTLGQINFYVNCGGLPQYVQFNHLLAPYFYGYAITNTDVIAHKCCCCSPMQQPIGCQDQPTNKLAQNVNFKELGTYYINLDVLLVMMDAQKAMRGAPPSKLFSTIETVFKNIIEFIQKLKKRL